MWKGVLSRQPNRARQVVQVLVEGNLVCQPVEVNGTAGCEFRATGTLAPLRRWHYQLRRGVCHHP